MVYFIAVYHSNTAVISSSIDVTLTSYINITLLFNYITDMLKHGLGERHVDKFLYYLLNKQTHFLPHYYDLFT